MATVIRMPSVLAGASEAAIAKWLVKPGDTIKVGDPFAELETEKAVVEYNSELDGTIGRLVIAEGGSGEIGAPIAVLIAAGETDADIDAALGGESAGAPAATPVAEAAPAATAAAPTPSATPTRPPLRPRPLLRQPQRALRPRPLSTTRAVALLRRRWRARWHASET